MAANETIFALSSGPVPAGVAVVRVSGPAARELCHSLCGGTPVARRMVLRSLRDEVGNVIDHGMICWFPGPRSFTGEDCLEFHLHGGRAVVNALLGYLGRQDCREAEPGEFTRRAYINGKLDLVQAEALADLIDAQTEAQRRLALENAAGGQTALLTAWRQRLLELRALTEAMIDFSDEDDVDPAADVRPQLAELRSSIERYRRNGAVAEIVRNGFRVVLAGAPNAGKSSLFNVLLQREAAIVSAVPGTTRDVLEAELDIDGYKVILTDTAGLRHAEDEVEQMGVERAKTIIERADLVLLLSDVTRADLESIEVPQHCPVIRLGTKADTDVPAPFEVNMVVSSVTGRGISDLVAAIGSQVRSQTDTIVDAAPFRARQQRLIDEALRHIEVAAKAFEVELVAESLRLAAGCIGSLTGDISNEEILGEIFSRFCIGK